MKYINLAENPELEWLKKYLWICEDQIENRKLETMLTSKVDDLLKSNFITFKNGNYNLNR